MIKVVINDVIFSAIMIRVIRLDFLFAMAARFGYGADGSDVGCGVLPESGKPVNVVDILDFNRKS
jgi:hypothetical protein